MSHKVTKRVRTKIWNKGGKGREKRKRDEALELRFVWVSGHSGRPVRNYLKENMKIQISHQNEFDVILLRIWKYTLNFDKIPFYCMYSLMLIKIIPGWKV